jgi:N-acyl-D-aspartate/D-glutamate deacylase
MPFDDASQLKTDPTALMGPSDGRSTDAFMTWWSAYAELLRAERRDERGRQMVHLEAELECAREALARERIAASRPPHNLLHVLDQPR